MRYLLILDAALFALAGTLAVVLAVVCLLYGFNASLSPRVAAEIPRLITVTASFSALAVVLGLAFWSLLRERSWYGWAQLAAAMSLLLGSMFLYRVLTV